MATGDSSQKPGGSARARLGALAAIAFWGVSFVATKSVVDELSATALVFARAGLGSALLFSLLAARGQSLPPRSSWPMLLLLGGIGVAFHQALQAYALTLTSAVSTGWLIGLTPIWSAVFSAAVLGERFGRAKLLGLALGFVGAAMVVGQGRPVAELGKLPSTRGDLLILASTFNWAVYSVIGQPVLRRLGPARATAGAMALGWLLLLPPFLWTAAWRDYARLSAPGWAAILFLGICCSGLGYLFWYGALDRLEASRVAAFLYLEPLVTLLAAMALIGERPSLLTLAGGTVLLAGVALVQWAGPGREEAATGNGRGPSSQ